MNPASPRFAWLLACWASAAQSVTGTPDILGRADDLDSGAPLYEEQYFCNDAGDACTVIYLGDGERLLASKTVDYRPDPHAPHLFFRDHRFDREYEFYNSDVDWVVDAGFDNFIRSHWQTLLRGEEVEFSMKLLARDEPLAMRAERAGKHCPPRRACFTISLDAWLASLLVAPIRLEYDRQTRRLLRYRGISNIRSDNGDSQKVEINYRYQEPAKAGNASAEATDRDTPGPGSARQ